MKMSQHPNYRYDPPPDLHSMWITALAILAAFIGSVLFSMIGG